MHHIERLTPPIRSGVRSQIYRVLADYASGGAHGPIPVKHLFLKAADGLVEIGIVKIPEFLKGQRFIERHEGRHPSFPDYGIPGDIANLMRQTFWELYLQGVLAPATKQNPRQETAWPHEYEDTWVYFDSVMLTPYGVSILIDSKNRNQVHDPDGYLSNFWGANPPPDPEMMRYLGECILVFRSGHLLACVVLLGIASERLMTVLAESLRDALGNPTGIDWFQKKYRGDTSDRFKAVINKLLAEYNKELEQEKLKEALQGIVTLTFEMIRHARNDIAHPKGREFTWNEVSGFLHSFVQHFKYINKIIVLLSNNPK